MHGAYGLSRVGGWFEVGVEVGGVVGCMWGVEVERG